MDEDQPRIGINKSDCLQRENVIGALQYPSSPPMSLILQVLQEAFVKAIGVNVTVFIQPITIARYSVGRVEAQARETPK